MEKEGGSLKDRFSEKARQVTKSQATAPKSFVYLVGFLVLIVVAGLVYVQSLTSGGLKETSEPYRPLKLGPGTHQGRLTEFKDGSPPPTTEIPDFRYFLEQAMDPNFKPDWEKNITPASIFRFSEECRGYFVVIKGELYDVEPLKTGATYPNLPETYFVGYINEPSLRRPIWFYTTKPIGDPNKPFPTVQKDGRLLLKDVWIEVRGVFLYMARFETKGMYNQAPVLVATDFRILPPPKPVETNTKDLLYILGGILSLLILFAIFFSIKSARQSRDPLRVQVNRIRREKRGTRATGEGAGIKKESCDLSKKNHLEEFKKGMGNMGINADENKPNPSDVQKTSEGSTSETHTPTDPNSPVS